MRIKLGLRILWNSDRLVGKSAYSKITYECCTRLAKMGHHVAHIPMGMANKMTEQMHEGVLVYKSGNDPWNEDVFLDRYAEYNSDILITLKEPWVFNQIYHYAINFVPYAIIDHSPVSISITTRLHSAFKVLVPSRFAQRELRRKEIEDVHYVPHGCRTDVYRQLEGQKALCKKQWFMDEDDFTVLMVSMNRSRKLNPRQFRIYKRFRELNPDVKSHLMFWGDIQPSRGQGQEGAIGLGVSDVGVSLINEILELGLGDDIAWPDITMIKEGIPEWAGHE